MIHSTNHHHICFEWHINKIMSKEQKDGRKIREFEWYEVETKVREIMS